jgi:ribosomal protein L40E
VKADVVVNEENEVHEEHLQDNAEVDRIEADAVCAKCNYTNPPGTLICRSCGNDLRLQRLTRIAAAPDEIPSKRRKAFRLISIAASVCGILLVVALALNVNLIASWLVGVAPESVAPEEFWHGDASVLYNAIRQKLETVQFNEERVRHSIQNGVTRRDLPGLYVLLIPDADSRIVGKALVVERENGRLHFVAVLENGMELRGVIPPSEHSTLFESQEVGLRIVNGYYSAGGFAHRRQDGAFSCIGITTATAMNKRFGAIAFPLP